MARGTQRRSANLGAHVIAWIFLGVMAFSLAYYEHSDKSWRDDTTYEVHAERLTLGAPRPWLSYNTVSMNGAPPPLEMLPGGMEYFPGAHVDVPRMCIAVTVAFGVALFLFFMCWLAWPDMQRRGEVPNAVGVLAIAFISAIVGFVTPTDPPWIGAALGLALVPIVITVVCWKKSRLAPVVMCAATAVLSLVWVQRMVALFWTRVGARDFDLHEDVLAPAAMFAMYVLIVLAVVTVKRLVTR